MDHAATRGHHATGRRGGVAAGRSGAQQPARVPRIGFIDDAPMWHSFRQALRDYGYVDGQSINYEYRYSEGVPPDRLATVVDELVRRPVDLIAAYGTPPTEAAKAATTTIPIVMVGVADPVRAGLVASLARPGNITGNTVLSPDLGAKRLQLLREAIPTVSRVAYLTNPDNPATIDVFAELKLSSSGSGDDADRRRVR